jgi:DNA damage-binding protein 1
VSGADFGYGYIFAKFSTARMSSEVSAVAVTSHPSIPAPVIAISTWAGELLLYSLDHLLTAEPLVTALHEPFAAASLVLRPASSSETSSGMQLLAGLSDGTMAIYDVELGAEGGGVKVTNRKASGLGTRPLQLLSTQALRNAEETILAVGLSERLSVVFESKGRIDFSTVNRKVCVWSDAGPNDRMSPLLLV